MATGTQPKTLQQAIEYFADHDRCHAYAVAERWPDGVVRCPQCGGTDVHYLSTQRRWECKAKHPRRQFSLKVGTVMEDSAIPLKHWLLAMWMVANCKNGVSSYEIHRHVGVTQKSAWFLLHRIRLAMQAKDGGKLGGDVEIDETFIGAKARNMHKDKKRRMLQGHRGGQIGKVAVMGLLQRTTKDGKSQVRLQTVRKVKRGDLVPHITKHVEPWGTTVFTDALPSYDDLWKHDYVHQVIDHATHYAEGNVHTNGMENFWSLLKRTLNGTYISVEPFHLFRYLDEQAFRFNKRETTDGERFRAVLRSVIGRRVTYKQLTANTEAA